MVPIDFSYTTSYRLSIVTFALDSRTHRLATIHNVTDDRQRERERETDGRNTVPIAPTVSTVG